MRVATIAVGNNRLNVIVPETPAEYAKGLGGRPSLDQNSGMLFPFAGRGTPIMTMDGMQFPLDFVYIEGGKVIATRDNVWPGTGNLVLSMVPTADYVLEVNGGYIATHGVAYGDAFRFA